MIELKNQEIALLPFVVSFVSSAQLLLPRTEAFALKENKLVVSGTPVPQGLNRYTYVLNAPTIRVDSSGNTSVSVVPGSEQAGYLDDQFEEKAEYYGWWADLAKMGEIISIFLSVLSAALAVMWGTYQQAAAQGMSFIQWLQSNIATLALAVTLLISNLGMSAGMTSILSAMAAIVTNPIFLALLALVFATGILAAKLIENWAERQASKWDTIQDRYDDMLELAKAHNGTVELELTEDGLTIRALDDEGNVVGVTTIDLTDDQKAELSKILSQTP